MTWTSWTLNAYWPNTSLVENSTTRSIVSWVASAASSALYVPITFTRIVRTGLDSTVSTPAIPAACTRCVAPATSSVSRSGSRTSPSAKWKLGCPSSSVPDSASRWRLSIATTSFSSTSRRARVVPMNPAPPVIAMRLPWSGTPGS